MDAVFFIAADLLQDDFAADFAADLSQAGSLRTRYACVGSGEGEDECEDEERERRAVDLGLEKDTESVGFEGW